MTESPNRVIIERIEPRSWALRVRDTKTDQVHELELRGGGPWKIELNGKAEVEGAGGKAQVAAPPDDAITLRLARSDGRQVRVGAVGRGAKAWASAQGTLLGSRWFDDPMGAPVVLLEDRRGLVDEIRAALPTVKLDLSKYTAEPAPHQDAPDVVSAANTAPAPLKKSRRGFGGKVKVPQHTDIELRLSNIGRTDSQVSVVAVGRREEVDAAEVLAWTQQRGASIGPWQSQGSGQVALMPDGDAVPEELLRNFPGVHLDVKMYKRPGVPLPAAGGMVFPKIEGSLEREEPHMARTLEGTIRRLSEEFIVIPHVAGHGFREVELRNDRSTGVYEGLPIGTFLLKAGLYDHSFSRPIQKHWEPVKQTLSALNRPTVQFEMLRESVTRAIEAAWSAASQEAQPETGTPEGGARDEVGERPQRAADEAKRAADPAPPRSPARSRGRKSAQPESGPGPGGLSWEPIKDGGVDGVAAPWGEGRFKLLPIGGDRYGLFYEHDGGGYETLLCGSLDEGKKAAGERASGARPILDLTAAQVACAGTRQKGPPTHNEITLHLRTMEGHRPDLMILATGDRVHEWVFNNRTILGHIWERGGESNFPMATMFNASTIVPNLRKEFPGVNIDTSEYKKPKADAPAPEPVATDAVPVVGAPPEPSAPPAAPPPSTAPPADDASQDAELMRSIKGQLADLLDEED